MKFCRQPSYFYLLAVVLCELAQKTTSLLAFEVPQHGGDDGTNMLWEKEEKRFSGPCPSFTLNKRETAAVSGTWQRHSNVKRRIFWDYILSLLKPVSNFLLSERSLRILSLLIKTAAAMTESCIEMPRRLSASADTNLRRSRTVL